MGRYWERMSRRKMVSTRRLDSENERIKTNAAAKKYPASKES